MAYVLKYTMHIKQTYEIISMQIYLDQVELGKVEGFWSTLQLLQDALANAEQQAHCFLMRKETNQLCHVSNNVIIRDGLHHLEFHDRNLHLYL